MRHNGVEAHMDRFRCVDPEAGLAEIAAEQRQVRDALESARMALKVRGEVLRGALQLSLALSECERLLAELDVEEVS